MYQILSKFANWFAATFRQEVTIFDRIASWFEPTQTDINEANRDIYR